MMSPRMRAHPRALKPARVRNLRSPVDGELGDGAPRRIRRKTELSTMALDDGANDREPEPRPALFRGHEGSEKVSGCCSEARPIVCNGELDGSITARLSADLDHSAAFGPDRFKRILDEVDKGLLDLGLVDSRANRCLGKIDPELDALGLKKRSLERLHALDDVAKVFLLE